MRSVLAPTNCWFDEASSSLEHTGNKFHTYHSNLDGLVGLSHPPSSERCRHQYHRNPTNTISYWGWMALLWRVWEVFLARQLPCMWPAKPRLQTRRASRKLRYLCSCRTRFYTVWCMQARIRCGERSFQHARIWQIDRYMFIRVCACYFPSTKFQSLCARSPNLYLVIGAAKRLLASGSIWSSAMNGHHTQSWTMRRLTKAAFCLLRGNVFNIMARYPTKNL